jgi:Nif-specific regulatory protein
MVTKHNDYGLKALYTISKILAGRSGQREMLFEILDVLNQRLGMSHGTVMLLSTDDKELIVEAVSSSEAAASSKSARYRPGEGITGKVLQSGVAQIVPCVSTEPEFRNRVHSHRIKSSAEVSFICVPIILDSDVIGTLSVDMHYDETLTLEKEKWLLSIVSSMVSYDAKNRRMAKLQRQSLQQENSRLRHVLEDQLRPEKMIGNSSSMRSVYARINQVAEADTTVLVTGESGCGKELVAAAVHYASHRVNGPFVKINCSALNEQLLESELFGHEKGSFTGASDKRIGRIEEAEGGTLFLDEIGDFSLSVQVKLLRVMQERQFERVGSNKSIQANIRIITATNRNLEKAIADGSFRQDLYYRINVFPIYLPPLRERKDDIVLLANHFVEKFAGLMHKNIRRVSTSAINMMLTYHWPGNVRELENCIEHAVLLSDDGVIYGRHLPATLQMPITGNVPKGSLKACVNALERDMIIDALKRVEGKIAKAAEELGITQRMVRYKIQNLDIDYNRLFKRTRG